MVWYTQLFQNFPQFIVIHTVKSFGIVNKAEVDVFLELSCFFHDPADVGNLISGSSAFSKTSLNIRKFMVHILLKPGLENFFIPESKTRGIALHSRCSFYKLINKTYFPPVKLFYTVLETFLSFFLFELLILYCDIAS